MYHAKYTYNICAYVDIATCTKEDLTFSGNFQLKAARNDFCHAFVAYFECAFTQVHKPIVFSTSPHSKYTHWKQTVFYLREPLTVCTGETVSGTIQCTPNQRNPRDLDIGLTVTFEGKHMQGTYEQSYRLR
jgi:protein arginine N-methyltransferase 1